MKKLWRRRRTSSSWSLSSCRHRTRTNSDSGRFVGSHVASEAAAAAASAKRTVTMTTRMMMMVVVVVMVVIMSMFVGGVADAFTVGSHSSLSSSRSSIVAAATTTATRLTMTSHTQLPSTSSASSSPLHIQSAMTITPKEKKAHHGGGGTTTQLNMAIIYGWDEYDDPADAEKKDNNEDKVVKKNDGTGRGGSGTTTPYVTTDNYNYAPFAPTQECPTVGASVAETLSGNIDRTGSLARLAVRFARIQNDEHSNLPIEEIENVRVLCVHSHSIELEATLCETHGCVSLHVPISFPTACSTTGGDGDGAEAHFEACVLQHLESLDDEEENDATTTVITASSSSSSSSPVSSSSTTSDIIQQWMDSTELSNVPAWWVDASKVSPELVKESKTLQDILNEDEFTDELKALARDALKGTTIESGVPYDSLIVEKSKCLSISHTGIALKIVGRRTDLDDSKTNRMILDVYYPFESGKKSSADSSKMSNPDATPDVLRKAVLGAVAIAS